MLGNVVAFIKSKETQFPAESVGGRASQSIETWLAKINNLGELPSRRAGLAATAARNKARDLLLHSLSVVQQTALAVAIDHPEIAGTFRITTLPRRDRDLIKTGREFAKAAAPFKDAFLHHLLPDSFLDELISAADGLQSAMQGQSLAKGDRNSNRASLEELLNEALTELLRLDAAIPNALRGDKSTLEAWNVARQVRRSRSVNKKKEGEQDPPASPTAA